MQLYGILLKKSKQMGIKIRVKVGMMLEFDLYNYLKIYIIVKVKVMLDTTKPLKPGLHIGNIKEGTSLVDFRGEKIPMCLL